ncbi:hypothetical protein [Nocardioides plantarum]|uniref:Transcriptional regulator, AbiEi antitoxin, Type IV TA system n=1 Tax=Nocardioides plantarum TaxID=29299 RepID=A0ABV5KCM4_9ACTN|nr:hypothetical protein [Nocardioides plantarum]
MTRPLTGDLLAELLAMLPGDRAFSSAEADDLSVSSGQRRLLVGKGLLRRPLPGVLHVAALPDTLDLRLQCLALVVPADCVVTDRTAAWAWVGERALAPGDHRRTPRASVFAPPGRRLRNDLTDSGERRLLDRDVVDLGGLRVTKPLRTACDQGRLLTADQGLAAMDSLATLRCFDVPELVEELDRFKGYRGIVQARQWAPWVDGGSDSPFESIARKRWIEAGLPRPQCQVPEVAPDGGEYFIDVGLPGELFGCEYFGEEFHGVDDEPADGARLEWLRTTRRWSLVVARRDNVVGPRQDLEQLLRLEWQRHRSARPVTP